MKTTAQEFHMMTKNKTHVYLIIIPPFFEFQDRIPTDDGALVAVSHNTARINSITLISNNMAEGCVVASATFRFQPGEGREIGADFRAGMDALRAAWRAELEPRAVRVELDEETMARLGAQVAAGLHGVAQADMMAELELEQVEASSVAQRVLETCGGAPAPGADEALALLVAPLDGDGVAHLVRHAALLGEVARMAHRADGEAVGVYLKAREASQAMAYLTERGFRFKGLVSVE